MLSKEAFSVENYKKIVVSFLRILLSKISTMIFVFKGDFLEVLNFVQEKKLQNNVNIVTNFVKITKELCVD